MKKRSKKLKILSFNTKGDRFYDYVINELVQNFRTDGQVREIMVDVLMGGFENLLNSVGMNDDQFVDIYNEYEGEISKIRISKIDNRVGRKPKTINNKMKKLLVCFCFDEVVSEAFREVYL